VIDFHNHVLPAVDDGAASLEESRAALAAFRDQGVRALVATPHLRASVTTDPAALAEALAPVDAAWEELKSMAGAEFPDLRLERGFEVALDTPAPDFSDPRVRLAGTRFVLVEFPFMAVPPNAPSALFELKMRGWTPVVAHPERYQNFDDTFAAPAEWRRVGAFLQLNAGSLLGKYGPEARTRAWRLLKRGMADFVSSDYHARGTLHTVHARRALEEAGGAEQARLLMDENPARLLEGRDPHPVPPLEERRSFLGRLLGRRR
jgi:protein-tyrosine phosphatase